MDTNTSAPRPPSSLPPDNEVIRAGRHARFGLQLFAVYVVLYGSFVVLNTFWPEAMGHPVFEGMNLAIVYGFVLIIAAFVLAMIYAIFCRGGAGEGGVK